MNRIKIVAAIPRKLSNSQRRECAGLLSIRDDPKLKIQVTRQNIQRNITRSLGIPDIENLRYTSIIMMKVMMSNPACVSGPMKDICVGDFPPSYQLHNRLQIYFYLLGYLKKIIFYL